MPVPTIDKLRERLGELADLGSLDMLAGWDQQVLMPALGGPARARQLATLARISHELATGEELGGWLAELAEAPLDELEADMVRLARRDYERAQRVPAELAAERSRAHAEGQERWRVAREADDFSAYAPALERNVELAREYGRVLCDDHGTVYDALLADYDWGLRTGTLRELFAALARELPPLVAEAGARHPPRPLEVPLAAQEQAVAGTLRRLGVEEESWRVDVSPHPFTAWMSPRDTRITTRYEKGGLEALLSSLHEYGHALYERQVDPALERTNLGVGTSMSMHESQSKLWENHVARSDAFAEVFAAELSAAGRPVSAGELHATLSCVQPSLIRTSADPLTYPLHIILRFELELALIEGGLAVRELPDAWREATQRLLGLEVPSDALGAMQDIHWASGAFGYFPSYALGCLIAAQLWETLERDLGPREEDLRRGEVGAIQQWLGERVHRFGRRLDTLPLLEQATGRGLEIEPFLRHVEPLTR